jgi:hypothetical protein
MNEILDSNLESFDALKIKKEYFKKFEKNRSEKNFFKSVSIIDEIHLLKGLLNCLSLIIQINDDKDYFSNSAEDLIFVMYEKLAFVEENLKELIQE